MEYKIYYINESGNELCWDVCNPKWLKDDIKFLKSKGYTITKVMRHIPYTCNYREVHVSENDNSALVLWIGVIIIGIIAGFNFTTALVIVGILAAIAFLGWLRS